MLAISSNIVGRAKLRLPDVMDMVHAGMNEGEYTNVIGYILDTIDPVYQKSSFLETAKTRRDFIAKIHGENQTYDQYWSGCSALRNNYAYTHADVAKSPVVQELMSLLFVINAKLGRSEFGIVLQSAIENRWKSKQKVVGKVWLRSAKDGVSCPSSHTIVENQYEIVVLNR